jgi:hypothetical protein
VNPQTELSQSHENVKTDFGDPCSAGPGHARSGPIGPARRAGANYVGRGPRTGIFTQDHWRTPLPTRPGTSLHPTVYCDGVKRTAEAGLDTITLIG